MQQQRRRPGGFVISCWESKLHLAPATFPSVSFTWNNKHLCVHAEGFLAAGKKTRREDNWSCGLKVRRKKKKERMREKRVFRSFGVLRQQRVWLWVSQMKGTKSFPYTDIVVLGLHCHMKPLYDFWNFSQGAFHSHQNIQILLGLVYQCKSKRQGKGERRREGMGHTNRPPTKIHLVNINNFTSSSQLKIYEVCLFLSEAPVKYTEPRFTVHSDGGRRMNLSTSKHRCDWLKAELPVPLMFCNADAVGLSSKGESVTILHCCV